MKNNRAITAAIIFFIGAIVIIIGATTFIWNDTDTSHTSSDLLKLRYHFVMISQSTEEKYWQQVHIGAISIAQQEKMALEYFGTQFLNLKELERFMEMAVLSSADGILVSVPNDPTFQSLINEALRKRIPVISLSTDIEESQKDAAMSAHSFVGINTFELGYKTGHILGSAVSGECQVAVLVNSNFSTLNYNRYLEGIRKALQGHSKIHLNQVINSKGESISAEEQTQILLKNHPEIGAIVCSDANDTLGVAKVVVDLNQVTQVMIIGCGLTEELIPYIKRGVIRGVLADNPRELGVQAMIALIRLKQGQSIQETYYMPLFLINAKNVDRITRQFTLPGPENVE